MMVKARKLTGWILNEDAKNQIPHDWDGGTEILIQDGIQPVKVWVCDYCESEGGWHMTKEEADACCKARGE